MHLKCYFFIVINLTVTFGLNEHRFTGMLDLKVYNHASTLLFKQISRG